MGKDEERVQEESLRKSKNQVQEGAPAAKDRDRKIVRTSVIGIIANLFLAAFKFIVGSVSGSISITLDAVNNLSDSLSSVITILGTKLAQKPADKKHPYGYGRVEYLSASLISMIVLYAGITSAKESVTKIIHPEAANYTFVAFLVLAVGVLVKMFLSRYVMAVGKETDSKALMASGSDAGFDSILSTSVLLAALLVRFTKINLEAWVGAVISAVIIKSGIEMLTDTLGDILGMRISADLSQKIKETIAGHDKVYGAYDLLLHAYGPSRLQGSVHIEAPEDMTVRELEALTNDISLDVYRKYSVILTGISVYSHLTSQEGQRIRGEVMQILDTYEDLVQMHGFYLDEERRTMKFDIILSFDTPAKKRQEEYREICDKVQAKYPDYKVMINLDSDVSD